LVLARLDLFKLLAGPWPNGGMLLGKKPMTFVWIFFLRLSFLIWDWDFCLIAGKKKGEP
jgi:hypothetical protein